MRLGGCTYPYLYLNTLEEALFSLAKLGFQKFELVGTPPHLWIRSYNQTKASQLKRLLNSLNLQITSINPTFLDSNPISLNPGFREESIRQMKEMIIFASLLDVPIVIFFLGRRHPLLPAPYEKVYNLAKDVLKECIPLAEKYNVIIGVENSMTSFMNTGGQLLRLVEDFSHSMVKIVYDVANGFMSEDPLVGLDVVKKHLALVHLSDTDTNWRHWPLGKGLLDFCKIGNKLKAIDFQGVSVIEFAESENPEADFIEAISLLKQYGWKV